MNTENKKCAMCAEMIPVKASTCPFCGAKYEVTIQGYCSKDHQVVSTDEGGLCPICKGPLLDARVESRFLEEPLGTPLSPTPSLSPPVEPAPAPSPSAAVEAAPAPQPVQADKPGKPAWRARLEGALTLPLVAGLLNLNGLGLGYLYLKKWRRWFAMLFLGFLLLIIAIGFNASSNPPLWAGILGGWLLLLALNGWWQARSIPFYEQHHFERHLSFAFYAAVVLLVVEGIGFLFFRHAGQETLEAGKAAYEAGDCTTAQPYLNKADSIYRLTLNPEIAQAEDWFHECNLIQEASSAAERGDFESAIHDYEWLLSQYPQSSLINTSKEGAIQTYQAWAAQLREEGSYEEALLKYSEITASYPGTQAASQVDAWVSETYMEWATMIKEEGDYTGAVAKVDEYLDQFPDSSREADLKNLASEIYAEWADQLLEAGDYEEALNKYDIILRDYRNSQAASEFDSIRNGLIDTGNEALAGGSYCQAVNIFDALSTGGYLPQSDPGIDLAEALFNCGQEKFTAEKYDEAIAHFETLIANYPDNPLVSQAEAAIVDARVVKVKLGGTGELAAPLESGWTSPGTSAVVVSNDSPERLEFLLSGPDSKSLIVEACESCETYSLMGPIYCPEKGPRVTISLLPGTYEVVVRTIDDSSITPWSGTWELADGRQYFNCFFIVTRFQ